MAGSTFQNCATSKQGLLLSVGLSSLLLLGCAQPVISNSNNPSKLTTMPQPDPSLAQFLPISATANIAGRTIELEVTRTIPEQAKGLMFREALPDNRGMLFSFEPPRPVAFWMKNVPVSLDMVFIYKGEVKAIANAAPPCTSEPCPVYPAEGVVVDRVIELRAGLAAELKLKVGDRITITPKPTSSP